MHNVDFYAKDFLNGDSTLSSEDEIPIKEWLKQEQQLREGRRSVSGTNLSEEAKNSAKSQTSSIPGRPTLIISFVLLLLFLFNFYVFRAVQTQELEMEIQDLKKDIKLAYIKNNQLQLDLSEKLSLKKIESLAKTKFSAKSLDEYQDEKIIYIRLPGFTPDLKPLSHARGKPSVMNKTASVKQ